MGRIPMLPVALAFAAGIALHATASVTLWWTAWAASVAGAAAALTLGRITTAGAAIIAAVMVLGALRATPAPLAADHISRLSLPRTAAVDGRLVAEPTRFGHERHRLMIDVEHVDGAPASGRLQLAMYGAAPEVAKGQRVMADARLTVPRSVRNPDGFDYAAALARDGIHVVASTAGRQVRVIDDTRPWHTRVRRRALDAIASALPPVSAALLGGLLLGARADLPGEILDGFRSAGVYHVLAVSGFNVALIAAAVFAATRLAGLPHRGSAGAAMAAVVAFAAVVGPEPSVLRAMLMAVLVLTAVLLDREASTLNSIVLAATVVLAVRPADLLDPGFQLSFAATVGIVLAPLPRHPALGAIGVSLAAQLAVLPITLAHFNQVSLIGVVANLGVVPLAGVATGLGVAAVALAPLATPVAACLFDATWPVLLAMRAIVHGAAAVPGALVHLPAPHWASVVLYVAALGLGLAAWRSRGRGTPLAGVTACSAVVCLVAAGAIASWPLLRPGNGWLRMTVLDIGQGDAIVIETPDRKVMVVDAGPGGAGRFDVGERVVAPYLWNRGVYTIDALVATHEHVDHAGGIPALRRLFAVRDVLDASRPAGTLGPVAVTLLRPPARPGGHDQTFVRLEYGLASFLLAPDADAADEDRLLAMGHDLRATVLKVGHHGSRHATSTALMHAVRPTVAVISVGARNAHGHPAPETLARLGAAGARVFRTDQDGAVVLETDGRVLHVTRWADRRVDRFCLDPEASCS
jgi:competence protein ComEC